MTLAITNNVALVITVCCVINLTLGGVLFTLVMSQGRERPLIDSGPDPFGLNADINIFQTLP